MRLSPGRLPFNDTYALSSRGGQPAKAQRGEGRLKLRGKEDPDSLPAVGMDAQEQGSPGLATCLWTEMRERGTGGLNRWRQTLRKCGVLRRMNVSRSTSPV